MTDVAAILDSYFRGVSPPSAWYIGLVDYESFVALDPVSDTIASHTGWTEFTDYAETTRQVWSPGVVIGTQPASVNNPGGTIITPNSDGQAIAVFLCDNDTKGGATGQMIGPFYFEEGPRDLVADTPFEINLNIVLKRNTPTS